MGNPLYTSLRELDRAMRAPANINNVAENYTGNRNLYDDIQKRQKYK